VAAIAGGRFAVWFGAGAAKRPWALLTLSGAAQAAVVTHVVFLPRAGRACQRRPWVLAANRRRIQRIEHAVDDLLRHLDEGKCVVDVDLADALTGDVGLVGDGADDIGRAHALVAPHAQEHARHGTTSTR